MGKIAAAETQARHYYDHRLDNPPPSSTVSPVEWSFAFEGQVIEL